MWPRDAHDAKTPPVVGWNVSVHAISPASRVLLLCKHSLEEVHYAVRGAVSEDQVDRTMRGDGRCLAAGEHDRFVAGQRGLDVVEVCCDRLSQLGAVEHGEVRTVPTGDGHVRRVAD